MAEVSILVEMVERIQAERLRGREPRVLKVDHEDFAILVWALRDVPVRREDDLPIGRVTALLFHGIPVVVDES